MANVVADPLEEDWVPRDNFGARLALIRQMKGWNVKQAAEACGLNDQSWRNWEAGVRPQGMDAVARKIARVAGCSYVWLLTGGSLVTESRWIINYAFQPELPMLTGTAA